MRGGERHPMPHTRVCQQPIWNFHTRFNPLERTASEGMNNFLGHKGVPLARGNTLTGAWKLWGGCRWERQRTAPGCSRTQAGLWPWCLSADYTPPADDPSPAGNIGNLSLSVLEGEVPQGAPRALRPHRPRPPHACQRIPERLAGGEGAAELLSTQPFRMRGEEVQDLLPQETARSAPFPRGAGR